MLLGFPPGIFDQSTIKSPPFSEEYLSIHSRHFFLSVPSLPVSHCFLQYLAHGWLPDRTPESTYSQRIPPEPSSEPEAAPETEPEVEPLVEPDVEPLVEPDVDPLVEPDVDPLVEPDVDPLVTPELDPPVATTTPHIFKTALAQPAGIVSDLISTSQVVPPGRLSIEQLLVTQV